MCSNTGFEPFCAISIRLTNGIIEKETIENHRLDGLIATCRSLGAPSALEANMDKHGYLIGQENLRSSGCIQFSTKFVELHF